MDQDKFLPHPLAWLRPEPCFMLYHTRPDASPALIRAFLDADQAR